MSSYSGTNVIQRATVLRNYKFASKLGAVILSLLAVLIVAMFGVTAIYNQTGSFTISVNKLQMVQYGITLSEDPDMYYQISSLSAAPLENASESKADWIDELEEIDTTNGSHNGSNYMAYTFYCINSSTEHYITYSYSLQIKSVTLNLDEAIRFKLFVDGEDKGIYGKQEPNGATPLRDYELNAVVNSKTGEITYDRSSYNLINKFANDVVVSGEITNLAPGKGTRFTVVMWIEGTDPECTNEICGGGSMRADMLMSVLNADPINPDQQQANNKQW